MPSPSFSFPELKKRPSELKNLVSVTPNEELPNPDHLLSDSRWQQFITDLEMIYWDKGDYPSTFEMAEIYQITLDQAESLYLRAGPVLEKRGLLPPKRSFEKLDSSTRKKFGLDEPLDPMFVLAVNKLSDPLDKRSNAVKLKDLGLSTKSFQAYLKQEKNRSFYERRLSEAFDTTEYSVKTSLMRNIESGDLNSIKYFHEYTGRFQSVETTSFNFIAVLQKVMEILARHLDQNVLDVLATEFEKELQKGE